MNDKLLNRSDLRFNGNADGGDEPVWFDPDLAVPLEDSGFPTMIGKLKKERGTGSTTICGFVG